MEDPEKLGKIQESIRNAFIKGSKNQSRGFAAAAFNIDLSNGIKATINEGYFTIPQFSTLHHLDYTIDAVQDHRQGELKATQSFMDAAWAHCLEAGLQNAQRDDEHTITGLTDTEIKKIVRKTLKDPNPQLQERDLTASPNPEPQPIAPAQTAQTPEAA